MELRRKREMNSSVPLLVRQREVMEVMEVIEG